MENSLSIIIPVFNGSHSLVELNNRLQQSLATFSNKLEIIFVDDFSKDNSWSILMGIQEKFDNVKIIKLSKNFGQHNATVCGINESSGDIIITLDDDLEHPPESIPGLLEKFIQEKRDLFYAIPNKREKNIFRNFFGGLWAFFARWTKKGTGMASSFRIMNRSMANCLLNHKEPFLYIESVLFWYTENIGYAKIKFEKRKHGKSNYSFFQLINLNHDLGIHYDTHILKFMMNFGIVVFIGSITLITYYLIKKITGNVVPGYSSLIITLLFSTGSILWGLGYLGLYIGRMFRILNKEPQYKIDKKVEPKN